MSNCSNPGAISCVLIRTASASQACPSVRVDSADLHLGREAALESHSLVAEIRPDYLWQARPLMEGIRMALMKSCGRRQGYISASRPVFLSWVLVLLLGAGVYPVQGVSANGLNSPDNLLQPVTQATWSVRTLEGAAGSATSEGELLRIDVTAPGAHLWDLFLQGLCPLQEGQTYRLRFLARAQVARALRVTGVVDQGDFHSIGLDQTKPLEPVWNMEAMTFTATKILTGHNVLQFQMGDQVGSVWIADVSLTPVPAPPTVAPTVVDPLLLPRVGEIRLEGAIEQVLSTQGRIVLLAAQMRDTNEASTAITPPRRKVVLIGRSTLLHLVQNGQTSLASLRPGETLIVVGKNQGSGKPLYARVIATGQ